MEDNKIDIADEIVTTITEKLRENEMDISFYYYKFNVLGSHDSYTRDEIVVKDSISLDKRQTFESILKAVIDQKFDDESADPSMSKTQMKPSVEYQCTYSKGDMFEPLWNVYRSDDDNRSEALTERPVINDNQSQLSDDKETEK
jgi:hypothetical protein